MTSALPPDSRSVLTPMTAVLGDVTMGRMRKLVIVDDHESFRSWAREVLAHEGFEVLGLAVDGRSAIELVRRLRPDVVLLDIQLPDGSGFDVAEQLAPHASVVLTSSRSADDYGRRVEESSAFGFVPKAELSGESLRLALARGTP
jgi:DNA-binding NarL/FixJ family response regulator